MPLINPYAVTLSDFGKRLGPDDRIAMIAELLTQTNEILEDMTFVEANSTTGHKTVIRTGLPSVAWRMLNYGVPQSKGKTQAVVDTCGMLESYAEVDKSLADLNGNTADFRVSEDRAFLEAMNQEMARTLFYGDPGKNPERFLGLAPRYSTLLTANAATAGNVINAGGTAANALSSIWLVAWGDQTVHGIYPKGSKGGFLHEDLGQQTLFDDAGGKYEGYRTHYKWDLGLTVRDWRYVVRIANIDLATITDDALIGVMVQASEMLPNANLGKPVFYMNRQVRTRLRMAMINSKNVRSVFDTVEGKAVVSFDEHPVKRCDVLLNTEAKVV